MTLTRNKDFAQPQNLNLWLNANFIGTNYQFIREKILF